jgi:hypothetical protein
MDVDTKEFWQSEPLHHLYFDEKEEIDFIVVLLHH